MDSIDIANITPEQVNSLLSTITSDKPDNQQIKKATELIKKYSENIQCVEGLLLQIKSNPNMKVRQLASIVLYKTIEKHWHNIDDAKQILIKNLMIELYSQEKEYLVLKGISNVIFKIAKQLLTNNQVDDSLITLIFSTPDKYSSEQANLFELNLYIIAQLVSTNMEYLNSKLENIKVILNSAFKMGSNKMKENAAQCLGSLISSLEKEQLISFKEYSQVIFQEIKKFSEKTILKIYETFCDFNLNSLYFFEDYFDMIIPTTLELILNEEYNTNLKLILSEFLIMIGQYKKKVYTKDDCKFLKNYIEVAFKLLCSEENTDEDEMYSESSLFSIGSMMIYKITTTISSKKVFPLLISIIQNKNNSNNSKERLASISLIGEMCEGCSSNMKDILDDLINLLLNKFNTDQNEIIKGQCILSMDSLAKYCSPDIYEYYDKILPMLITGLYSSNEKIIEKSLYEIDFFCQNIDFEVEEYLNMNIEVNSKLLGKLINILETSKSMWIVDKCLTALGTVIPNAKNLDANILMPIIETLKQITVNKTTENDQKLIGSTLNCVANIIIVILMDKFAPYEEYFSKFAFECIKSKVYELQFGGMCYFSALAEIKKEKFAPLLDPVMENAINIIKDTTGLIEKNQVKDEYNFDSDSEEDMNGNNDVYWHDDFIEAKCAAFKAVGTFAKSVPEGFVKYFMDFCKLLDEYSSYVCEDVVFDVVSGFEALMYSIDKATQIINGEGQCLTLDNFWLKEVFPTFEEIIESTDNQELVSETICSLYLIIERFGRRLFVNNNVVDRCVEIAKKLLNSEMNCQIKNNDADEDELDYEEDIIDSVKNLCLILAEKLENDFHPYFSQIFPLLKKYLKLSHPEEDRSLGFGIIADTLKYTKISTKFYIKDIFESIQTNLNSKKINKKDESLLRHIAYLIGMLFESDVEAAKPYIETSMNYLQEIYGKTQKEAKDNVLASMCRIIRCMNYNKQNFPLFEKSIEIIFSNLPFKHDKLENLTVLEFFGYLINVFGIEDFQKYVDRMMGVLKEIVINEPKYLEKTANENSIASKKGTQIAKVRQYLELVYKNETIKNLIEGYINTKLSPTEKEKFIAELNKPSN